MTGARHIRNLLDLYDETPAHELAQALDSYQRYHDLCEEIAIQTGFEVPIACGVFAALSPNNSYVINLRNALALLRAAADGRNIGDFRVSTYDNNKRKAWAMAMRQANPIDLFKGPKTKAFYSNILAPSDPEHVTVDGHMFWAWHGKKGLVKSRTHSDAANVTAKVYAEISDGIKFVAELRAVVPCQAQAVLWQTWRRKHNVMGASQMELLASDAMAIGLTNHRLTSGVCGI